MPTAETNHSQSSNKTQPTPCRTCTDFKSWAKQQREVMGIKKDDISFLDNTNKTNDSDTKSHNEKNCPLDKDELGKSTWGLLHTMAAKYPEKPTIEQVTDMTVFFKILSKYYPCEFCAKDFRKEIKEEPINVISQFAFSQWLCRLHNKVNIKLGKPIFDCSKVNERWRDGWKDGSCDM